MKDVSRQPVDGQQRRQHARAPVRLAAQVTGAGVPEVAVWIHNVSTNGMLLVFAERPDHGRFGFGTPVDITVASDPERPAARRSIRGHVRWAFAYGVGVAVSGHDATMMRELCTLAAERRSADAEPRRT